MNECAASWETHDLLSWLYASYRMDTVSQLLKSSRTFVTTDGRSASLSWCQAPPGDQVQIFITVRQLRV
jgi:hypothetical protein